MKSTTITDEQAENARMAYALFAGVPAKHVNLNTVRSEKSCGTVGCVAGWISGHKYFINKGLEYHHFDGVSYLLDDAEDGWTADLNEMSQDLFGDENLFNSSRHFDSSPLSQKREGLRRIRLHLLKAGRITQQRSDELAAEEKAIR